MLAGGAGYGEPGERDRGGLEADIADGFVTPQGAARDYGIDLRRRRPPRGIRWRLIRPRGVWRIEWRGIT